MSILFVLTSHDDHLQEFRRTVRPNFLALERAFDESRVT